MTDIKTLQIRLPKELWLFLRKQSIVQELSMNKIILLQMDSYKNKLEKGKKRVDSDMM
jgi:hypothetical protein